MDFIAPYYQIPYDFLGNGPTCSECKVELYGDKQISDMYKGPREYECLSSSEQKYNEKYCIT